ncbi:MAG: hypothetical protein WC391_02470 [Methanoregula sp.]|jgi:hypothetical protein
MKKLILAGLVIGCIILCGCTSAVSSFTTPKQNLKLNEPAVFEKDGYAFTVGIDHIDIQKQNSGARDVTVTLRVTNTGTTGTTLTLSPRIIDASGNEYTTSSIFYSQIAQGFSVAKKGTITIPGSDAFAALGTNAVISVRIQGASPFAYEASWDVDNSTFAP